ncbi:hypothetical protein NCCP2716_04430 [Sporosarcina sp. NCCP-2716]|uniref:heptaprenyl diphosphate synthase component 1 n=1 Tax=Sporosarcina sp. NCCP-2716 TaxID=2943679 RepID=UPI00203EDA5E|nr:heptaprenyl diphosphate synthase component 1 [Sporosarcina sp. NCCP-2716]GKV67945.1 hypothetical protein NCCP2716_04430 [Sporosarcina sp. NCCP-2716]
MNKQEVTAIIENYMKSLQEVLREPTLNREITDFPVDADKAFYLLLPLLNENREFSGRLRGVTLSIGAIQAALDIHDRIHRTEATSPVQQLTVLAGDHFSGIHYRILAETGEFALIRELSKTIAHINEQKTALQNDTRLTAERLVERMTVIETACISTFYSLYGFGSYRKLAEYALTYIRLNEMTDPAAVQAFDIDGAVLRQAIDLQREGLRQELQRADGLLEVLKETAAQRLGAFDSLS